MGLGSLAPKRGSNCNKDTLLNKRIEEKKKQEHIDERKQEDETESAGDTSSNKLLLELARTDL